MNTSTFRIWKFDLAALIAPSPLPDALDGQGQPRGVADTPRYVLAKNLEYGIRGFSWTRTGVHSSNDKDLVPFDGKKIRVPAGCTLVSQRGRQASLFLRLASGLPTFPRLLRNLYTGGIEWMASG